MNIVPAKDIPRGEDIDLQDVEYIEQLYNDLTSFARNNGFPLGLSAVQLGIPKKFFIARTPISNSLVGESEIDFGYMGFINCSYVAGRNNSEITSIEGCLSLPQKLYKVNRFVMAKVDGYLMTINPETFAVELLPLGFEVMNKYFGVVLQHEIDHHFGILISDIGEEIKI